jgi:hypothetical protein
MWISLVAGCAGRTAADRPDAAVPDTALDDEGVIDAGDDGAEDAPLEGGIPRCGSAPYVPLTLFYANASKKPLAGVLVRNSLCPDAPVTSDATGYARFFVGQNTPVSLEQTQVSLGFHSVFGESKFQLPEVMKTYLLPSNRKLPKTPPEGRLLPVLYVDPALTPPCNDGVGVRFSVKDHPEAMVTYYYDDGTVSPEGMTSVQGLAVFITGLAVGSFVQVEAAKDGCSVRAYEPNQDSTLRSPVIAGFDTVVPTQVSAPAVAADAGASD